MGQSVFPAPSAASKTRKVETLTSGTSWTVPAGVTYVNATLVGGGGGGGSATSTNNFGFAQNGGSGMSVETTVATTPGASITYAIGAGGAGRNGGQSGGTGGTTTFTGATSATGGNGGGYATGGDWNGQAGLISAVNNGGLGAISGGSNNYGGAGGPGWITLEYWV